MYKKPVEVLAKEIHYEPLPGEVRSVVIAAWIRGGLIPREMIEKIVPANGIGSGDANVRVVQSEAKQAA
jgi:hypothetical protein